MAGFGGGSRSGRSRAASGARRRGVGAVEDGSEDGSGPPLTLEQQVAASRARALRMLERRGYSIAELTRKLTEKGDALEVAQATVERLAEAGVLDDAAYARQVARSYLVGRGASVRRAQQEMSRRGLSREIGAAAIAEVRGDEGLTSEDDSVERAVRKKLKSMSGLDAATRSRRMTAYLARRGYDMDAIRKVVRGLRTVESPGEE